MNTVYLILLILFSSHLGGVELSIREGSVFLRPEPGQPFSRILESIPLPMKAEWQTSADFYGGLVSNQGFYPLGPASHFVLRSGALYRRENTEFRHILDVGMESEKSQIRDDSSMILTAVPSVLLSRKRTFENREVAGKIRLSHEDYIRSPSKGLQTIQMPEGITITIYPQSELVVQATRIVLIDGAVQVSAKSANSRFEILAQNTLIALLGTRAQVEHQLERKTTKAIAVQGVLRVEDRHQNSSLITELLRPGEILIAHSGKFNKPQPIPSHLNLDNLADSWLEVHQLPPVPEEPILNPVSRIRAQAESLTERAQRYRENQENPDSFSDSQFSEPQTSQKTRPFDWLSQEEVSRNQLPQGLNRQAAQNFPPHPRGLSYSGFHATDTETRHRNHELGEANRSLDERVRIQKESLRLGIDPQAIRQGTRLSDSQLSQTQQFLVQREREASRLSAEINRHEREREQLERKLELVERRGGDNVTLLRLRQDKQELQLRSEELRNSQRRLQELIREANQQLIQSRIQSDQSIQREDTLLKKMRNRIR